MDIVVWIIFGVIVGLVAQISNKPTDSLGIIQALLLGITGALIGGTLANVIFGLGAGGFTLTTLSIAVAGSIVVFLLGKVFAGKKPFF